jgi:hypothetical protein
MAKRSAPKRGAVCFVDDAGGSFAAIAAAFAGAAGREVAAASTIEVAVPSEIDSVLGEVGLTRPEVGRERKSEGERIDVSHWGHALHRGEGELERLALARIARDRIERRVKALLA